MADLCFEGYRCRTYKLRLLKTFAASEVLLGHEKVARECAKVELRLRMRQENGVLFNKSD